jgi:predicted GNAT superfamily acetyltransferase
MSSVTQSGISIRPLLAHEELDGAVVLQRQIWGYHDLEVDSRTILTVATRFAGQVLGAFDQERLVGFSLAFASLPAGHLHSHRVGIHPDYQNRGIGRILKLAQRSDALARGIDVIQWTFDPLQARNAHFNLVRLGAFSRTYIPNLYGVTTSPLHRGLPTDRLLMEWHLQSDRVRRTLAGEQPPLNEGLREIRVSTSQPADLRTQTRTREQFQDYFQQGYVACGLRMGPDFHIYVLEHGNKLL